MNDSTYFKTGKVLFAIAIIAVGLIHFTTRNFPTGLMPVDPALPGRAALVYLGGTAFVLAGFLLLTNKFMRYGALGIGIIWLILIVVLYLPQLMIHQRAPSEWTVAFEAAAFLAGACMLSGYGQADNTISLCGRYLFAAALVVFGVQHYMYAHFISALISPWIPGKLFFSYLVMVAFFASAISIIVGIKVKLSSILLAAMFLLWVLILHLPRVVVYQKEPEWTSMFVALAFSGIALLNISATPERKAGKL